MEEKRGGGGEEEESRGGEGEWREISAMQSRNAICSGWPKCFLAVLKMHPA